MKNRLDADAQSRPKELLAASVLARAFGVEPTVFSGRLRAETDGFVTRVDLLTKAQNVFTIVYLSPAHGFNVAEARLKAELDKMPTAGIGVLIEPSTYEKRCLQRRFDRSEFEYISDYRPVGNGDAGDASWVYMNSDNPLFHPLGLISEKVEGIFFEGPL